MLDIKKLREKQNKAGFGRLYKNENGLAAWTYEGMRPVVAAQSKNLNNALAHIDYIVAAANALPEALDEIERLRADNEKLRKIAAVAGEGLAEMMRRYG